MKRRNLTATNLLNDKSLGKVWSLAHSHEPTISLTVETPGSGWAADEHAERLQINCTLEQLQELKDTVEEAIKVAKWERDNYSADEIEHREYARKVRRA